MIVAKQQGLSPEEVREIGVCGLLHDIGKTKIPNAILNKPGKLNDDEFAIMRQHSTYSYNMIKDHAEFSPAVCLVFCNTMKRSMEADTRWVCLRRKSAPMPRFCP